VAFPAGHQYLVIAVDPDNTACNRQNGPRMLACLRSLHPAVITGSASGPCSLAGGLGRWPAIPTGRCSKVRRADRPNAWMILLRVEHSWRHRGGT
jgi:hypothetical protein